MSIIEIINELKRFSITILELQNPVQLGLVEGFEKKYKVALPNDFKLFLSIHNGASLDGTEVYGIEDTGSEKRYALDGCYNAEHFLVGNAMPLYLVPFSPDGGGNHYCFDIRICDETSCPVVFWQHDYPYSEEDAPEVTHGSFSDWAKEVMIDWVLEDYNYDGSNKN
jgi:cell wall assembly regulator SMI1